MTTVGKICKWTLLISFALLILVGVSLWLFFPVEKAKQIAIEKGTELLEREIEIETASVSFWGGIGIQLDNIVIKNQNGFSNENFLTAKSLDVKLQFWPLISGDVAIDRLILKEPKINLYKQKSGNNNFTFKRLEKDVPQNITEKVSPETKAVAAIVTFENIEIQNGTLGYIDDSTKLTISVTGLDLQSTLTHPFANEYISNGDLSINSISINDNKNLPDINLVLKYQSKFNTLENLLTISHADFSINGIPTQITGTVENVFTEMHTKINIQSEQTNIKKLTSLIPADKKDFLETYVLEGNLSFNFDIEYSIKQFLYYGNLILQDFSAAHKDLPGKLICKEALVDIKNDNLRFNIKEGEFDGKPIKGHLTIDDFESPFINSAFAGTLNLKYLEPFLPPNEKHTISGGADFDIKTSGNINSINDLKFNGKLRSDNIFYNSTFIPEPIDSLMLDIYFDNEIISIKKLTASMQSGSFSLDGRITSLMQYFLADSISNKKINPTIDATLLGEMQLSLLNTILPPKGKPDLNGNLRVDLQLSGSINNLSLFKPFGKVRITNGSYSDALLPEKIEKFDAELTILPDTIIVENLKTEFETSDAFFQGKLINPFPYLLPLKNINRNSSKKPLFVFSFKSNRFDADKLFPEAVLGVADENMTASVDSISTIILPDIDGRGTFEIDTLIYAELELTSLVGKVTIEDKKIECYDVNGNVYSGKIEGNTTIDLTDFDNPQYVGTFNAIQIEVNDFANRFSKLHDIVYGKVDMNGTYSANGWEPKQFLQSLTMNSTSSLRQGKISLSGAFYTKANELFKAFDSTLQKEQTIQNFFTNIIVKDGTVSFDKLKTQLGSIGDLEIDGYYNFNNTVSYDIKTIFSKKLKSKMGLLSVPSMSWSVSGTVDNPQLKIDKQSVLKNSIESLYDKLRK